MTDTEKLDFILHAIAIAGGPDRIGEMTDQVFLLKISSWILRDKPALKTEVKHSCGCGDTI